MDTKKDTDAPPIGFNLSDFNSTTQLTDKRKEAEGDEYDPFEHREIAKPNTTFGALAHLLKSSLGTGILAMPMAFKNSGLLFGAVATIVVGFLCTHCVHILVQTSHNICRKSKTPSLGFSETAEKVFEYGPPATRRFAGFAKQFCDYGLMATYYGANCVYILFISQSVGEVINDATGLDWDVRIYIIFGTIACLLIGQIRELKYLVPFSALANLFIVITFGITLYYLFNEELVFDDKPLFSSWAQLPLFFSTVIFAMEGIGTVMPIANSMIYPRHFLGCPSVLNTAMITVVTLYTVIGFFGYVRFGEGVKGSVTLNLPPGVPMAQVAQILIAIAILFTFGLQFYAPMEILTNKIQHKIPKGKNNIIQIVLRSGIILVMGCVAAGVPDLEPFIGLIGAVFFSILGLFVPSVVETVYIWPNFGIFKWKLIKNFLLALFAIIALVSGSVVSINEIVNLYTKSESEDDSHSSTTVQYI